MRTSVNSNYRTATKLRPHTTEFLERVSELYEMDIITFGDRKYAYAIAKALFPAVEEMVAIIDDRPDVWDYSVALLQVRPYKFLNVDDINAPPSSSESRYWRMVALFAVLFLVSLTGQKGDLKEIMTGMCKQVLEGCVVLLSGIVPLGSDPRRSDAYRIATKFGATVEEELNERTTHVIAAKWGTKKVQAAARLGLPVVSPEWLYACMELWEKAPKQQCIITAADTSIPIGIPRNLGSNIVQSA